MQIKALPVIYSLRVMRLPVASIITSIYDYTSDGGGGVAVITKDDLEIAFRKTLGGKGYSEEQILELAEEVITLFGFDNAVIDNRLAPHERDIFYKLEEEDLVHTQQEEVTITKGKVWRLHYWFLNQKLILKLSRGEEEPQKSDEFSVYAEMDEEMWVRREDSK
jgi:hypothetical protein